MNSYGTPNRIFKKGNIKDIPEIPSLIDYLMGITVKPVFRTIPGIRKCKCCEKRFPKDEMINLGNGKYHDYLFCKKCAEPKLKNRERLLNQKRR